MLMLGRETNQPADLMFGEGQERFIPAMMNM
jgi:hypothetical protein